MVENTGKTVLSDTFKPVNIPAPVHVEEDISGMPAAIRTPRRLSVEAITDRWRVDDEWWRREPISRFYYTVILTSGQRLVIYKDLITGRWWKQS